MLSVSKIGGGKSAYYLSMCKQEYYIGETVEGQKPSWFGKGVWKLGIRGEVNAQEFKHLFDGFSPDGKEKLVGNAGRYNKGKEKAKRNRMPGYDLCFTVVKSVSYAWSLASPRTRADIESAFLEAVKRTLERIEKDSVSIRYGKNGKVHERAGSIVMTVMHGAARQVDENTMPDQNLHVHAVLINAAIGNQTGKSGALNGCDYLHKNTEFAKTYGRIFREWLAEGIGQLGFELDWKDREERYFEIRGIAESEISRCSKRTEQIERLASRKTHSYKEQKKVNLKSRIAKKEYDPSVIFTYWHEEARKNGYTSETIEALRRGQDQKKKSEANSEQREGNLLEGRRNKEKITPSSQAPVEDLMRPSQSLPLEGRAKTISNSRRLESTGSDNEQRETREVKENKSREKKSASQVDSIHSKDFLAALKASEVALRRAGTKVLFVTYNRAEAEQLKKAGMTAAHISVYLRENETDEEKRQRMHTRPKQKMIDKLTLKPNPTPHQRKMYAEYKHITGQWSQKTKAKYLGEHHKPSSKLVHEFKYMTWQISKKQRDYLNYELEKKEREVSTGTLVVSMGGGGLAMDRLKLRVEAKGALLIDYEQLIAITALSREEEKESQVNEQRQEQRS